VRFAGASVAKSSLEDVDRDGDLDLMLHFRREDTNLLDVYEDLLWSDLSEDGDVDRTRQAYFATLTGQTTDHVRIQGTDQANIFLSGKKLRELIDMLMAELP
jgi:hypothetical protein